MTDALDRQLQEQGIPFGKYRLVAKLAIGGMAELFVAKQTGMGGFSKTVAVKCILPFFARDQEFIAMFLDEARLAAHLNHPNVVHIHDIGDVDGVFYMTMEYIPGQNLKSVAKRLYTQPSFREAPPFATIGSVMVQALRGLEHVHNATDDNQTHLHLVHRDISPNNLMLSYDGNVKIVDFGVAKAKTQERETQVGVLKGRLSYMSPEHLSGQPLDGRSDIFAMGVVLYELTTNRRLFKRKSEAETMQALMTAKIPPPTRFYPDFPPTLEEILLKSLKRDPNDRFQSAAEMHDAIEDWLMSYDASVLGNRHLVSMMEELFYEEKENDRNGIYPTPVTQDDLLNLARGSYRVMQDGSIYSYFSVPGSSPYGGQEPAPHESPSRSGSFDRHTSMGWGQDKAPPDAMEATNPHAQAHDDPEESTNATRSDTDVEQHYTSSDSQDIALSEGQALSTSSYPGLKGPSPSTASYNDKAGLRALERAAAASATRPLTPAVPSGPGRTAALPVPRLADEAKIDEEDVGDAGFGSSYMPVVGPDDDVPRTVIEPVPPGSDDEPEATSVGLKELPPPAELPGKETVPEPRPSPVIEQPGVSLEPEALEPARPPKAKKKKSRPGGKKGPGPRQLKGPGPTQDPRKLKGPGPSSITPPKPPESRSLSRQAQEKKVPVPAPEASSGKSRRGILGAAAVLLMLAAGGGGWWFVQSGQGSGDPDPRIPASGSADAGAGTERDAGEPTPPPAPPERQASPLPQKPPVFRMQPRPRDPRRPEVRRPRTPRPQLRKRTLRKRKLRKRKLRKRTLRRRRIKGPLKPIRAFSTLRGLDVKLRLRVYKKRGGRRVYTQAHPRLCRKIERAVGKLFGRPSLVRGVTRPWQRYVRKRFARSRRGKFVFYPRAAAYVIFRDLSRGHNRATIAKTLVKYQKTYRFSRYRNK